MRATSVLAETDQPRNPRVIETTTEEHGTRGRLIGHVFIEADGSVTITPCVRSTIDDIRRVKARLCCSRWRSIDERMLAGRERGR